MNSRLLPPPRAIAALLLAAGVAASHPLDAQAPSTFRFSEATIDDLRDALRTGRTSCHAVVDGYLKRIAAYDKAGPNLNAVQTVNPRALEEADRLDAAYRASGPVGPLHCVPVLLKDQVETRDMPTTYGSAIFKDFTPARDATVVKKLKAAGAIILAKTTMGEFASRYVGSSFGVVRNPYDPTRNASGSSGGSGAGVAANFGIVGIGEDTGGSVRGPASVASLVGLRPTVPLVSRFGMMPAKPTTDTLGPMARTVRDAALTLDAIAGYDPDDRLTVYAAGQVPKTYTAFLDKDGLKGARIGVLREPLDPATDTSSDDYKKVRAVVDRAVGELRTLGATVVDPVSVPNLRDRVRRGYELNVFETEQALKDYLAAHPNAPVRTLGDILMTGKVVPWRAIQFLPSVGKTVDDAGYGQVMLVREETRQLVLKLMADQQLDALVYATFDHQPTPIAADVLTNPNSSDGYSLGNNRYLASTLAFPALTVPAGFTTDDLPVGLEFLGRAFSEGTLLKLGYAFEQGTHHRKPPARTPELR